MSGTTINIDGGWRFTGKTLAGLVGAVFFAGITWANYRAAMQRFDSNEAMQRRILDTMVTKGDVEELVRESEARQTSRLLSIRDVTCPRPLWLFRGPESMKCALEPPTWERP